MACGSKLFASADEGASGGDADEGVLVTMDGCVDGEASAGRVGRATFVLVDAENTGETGAVVTLGGDMRDAAGQTLGMLKPESLFIPAGDRRTFALVDTDRKARPTAAGAQITVRGALIPEEPPVMHVEDIHTFDDFGKQVVQGMLVGPSLVCRRRTRRLADP